MTTKIHRTDVQMRFADTDALGHVNNAVFATYSELARLDFLRVLGGSVHSMILASIAIDFRRQVKLGDVIHVDTWIAKVGSSSFTTAQTVFANGERAADIRCVVVHFDYVAAHSRPLTNELRESILPYLAAGSP